MKRLLSFLIMLCLLCCTTASAEESYFSPNAVDLYFPGNPTTGYEWTAEVADPDIVAVKDKFFEDSHQLGFAGIGGTHWFHFNGMKEGATSVTFRYARSWEPDEPVYEIIYRLSVDELKNVLIWGMEMQDQYSLPPAESAGTGVTDSQSSSEKEWAPDITFSTFDTEGNEWTSDIFADAKLTMLNLWAYWCPPCVSELPDIQRLSDNYKDMGLQVFGVSPKDYEENNISTMEKLNITYPTLRLTQSIDAEMNTGYVPTTIFVNSEGHIVGDVCIGSKSYDAWAKIIDGLLE